MKRRKEIIRSIGKVGILLILSWFPLVLSAQDTPNSKIRKEFKIKKGQTHLNLPISSSAKLLRATLLVDGKPIDRFTINLATANPSFWTFFDVSPYQGRKITLEVENSPPQTFFNQPSPNQSKLPESNPLDPKLLDQVFVDSKFPGLDSLYKEKGRPQVHFTAARGWINDPNGLIYYNGEYHMYFQHNPYGWNHGNMHWGHAVSKDLIHWKQLNEAIFPLINDNITQRGDAAFSGSAVSDPQNTAGFRKNGIDPLIAVYTSTGRGECLKMSYDNGRTFEDFSGNPVLKHNGRDPKVFWYDPGKHWVMVVWESGYPKKLSTGIEVSLREHSIYSSPDLKNWTYQSGVSGFFECPELFELPVEGVNGLMKWIMYDAHGRYIVGDFNGKKFSIDQHFTKYENGGGYFYASQTFNNSPDQRRIQIGWGRNITNPGMPFNQPELFPTELKLKKTYSGYRLCPTPINEISSLHKDLQVIKDKLIQSGGSESIKVDPGKPLHIIVEVERGDAPISVNILGYEIQHDNEWLFETKVPIEQKLGSEKPAGPFPAPTQPIPVYYVPGSDIFKIEAIIDKNILEIFINDGELYYVTAFNAPKVPKVEVNIPANTNQRSVNRKLILKKLEVYELKSIWSD